MAKQEIWSKRNRERGKEREREREKGREREIEIYINRIFNIDEFEFYEVY